jgi:hypothetical protein
LRLSKPQGLVWPEQLDQLKNSSYVVSNPLPSSLQHSALTLTLLRSPMPCCSGEH